MKYSEIAGFTCGYFAAVGVTIFAGVPIIVGLPIVFGSGFAGRFVVGKIAELMAHQIGVQVGGSIRNFAEENLQNKPLLTEYFKRLGSSVEKSIEAELNDIDAGNNRELALANSLDLAGAKLSRAVLQETVDRALYKVSPCCCPAYVRSRVAAAASESIVSTTSECLQELGQSITQAFRIRR